MKTATLDNIEGLQNLNKGIDLIVIGHKEIGKPLDLEEMRYQVAALQSLFSPTEIASMFVIAANRLAGHNTEGLK